MTLPKIGVVLYGFFRRWRGFWIILALCLSVAGCDNTPTSSDPADSVQETPSMTQAQADKSAAMPKLGTRLNALSQAYEDYMATEGAEKGTFVPTDTLVRVADGHVLIDAVAETSAKELLRDLETVGLVKGAAFGRVVSGRLPIDALPKAAELASLRFARAAQPYQ